jgi:predicted anti-sigma-YlaC factor YlaD
MKKDCSRQHEVERWFDGESATGDSVPTHIESCDSCRAHVAFLTECREAIAGGASVPSISDAQVPAFLEGISDAVNAPRRRMTGFWAMASALTAALIVAISAVTIVSPGQTPVEAKTEIETVSTDIDGATIEILDDDSTTPTVWLTLPEGGEI